MKKTLGHVGKELELVPAAALLGGTAVYLLAHVAFRLRNVHSLNKQRLVTAVLLVAAIPLATHIAALASVALVAAVLALLIAYEAVRFSDARDRVRHELAHQPVAD